MLYLLFIVILIVIQAILYLCHFFVFKTIVKFFSIESKETVFYLKIVFGFLSTTFIIASLLSSRYQSTAVKVFYNLTFYWVGLLFFLFFACAVAWGVNLLGEKFSLGFNPKIIIGTLFSFAVVLAAYSTVNANDIRTKNLDITLLNLPQSWQGKKAVWISDVHLGQVRGEKFAKEVTQKINEINPDIVFVGGDLYDGADTNLDKVSAPFLGLKASLGVYYVTGNHEEFDGNQKYLDAARKVNMKILNNEMVDISGLQLIGVDYRDTSSREQYKKVLESLKIDPNKPSILLKHSPFYVEEAEKAGISFQISGHSHGGQMFPMNYISKLIFYGYESGLHKLGNLLVYTSTGTGTWGPPMRLGADPEIVEIEFK